MPITNARSIHITSQLFNREVEWLFSTDPGRQQLAESAGFERLVVVTMHRGHTYPSLEEVKEEVAAKAMELTQHGLPHGMKVRDVCNRIELTGFVSYLGVTSKAPLKL